MWLIKKRSKRYSILVFFVTPALVFFAYLVFISLIGLPPSSSPWLEIALWIALFSLGLLVASTLATSIINFIAGFKQRSWKRFLLGIVLLLLAVALAYYWLLSWVTSQPGFLSGYSY